MYLSRKLFFLNTEKKCLIIYISVLLLPITLPHSRHVVLCVSVLNYHGCWCCWVFTWVPCNPKGMTPGATAQEPELIHRHCTEAANFALLWPLNLASFNAWYWDASFFFHVTSWGGLCTVSKIGRQQTLSKHLGPGPISPPVPMWGRTSSRLPPGRGASFFLVCLTSSCLVDSKRGRVLRCLLQACEEGAQSISIVFGGFPRLVRCHGTWWLLIITGQWICRILLNEMSEFSSWRWQLLFRSLLHTAKSASQWH